MYAVHITVYRHALFASDNSGIFGPFFVDSRVLVLERDLLVECYVLAIEADARVDIHGSQVRWRRCNPAIAKWRSCRWKWVVTSHSQSRTTVPWHALKHSWDLVNHIRSRYSKELIAKAKSYRSW